MEKLSIIIPARNEPHLNRTIEDLKKKSDGDIEIIAVLDGHDADRIDGVKYIYHREPIGMKYAINSGAEIATGKYIMKLDAHCIVGPEFDLQLKKDHQPNWIQIPRRCKLLSDIWKADLNNYIDYEYWIWPPKYPRASLHGFRWKERQKENAHIPIDDTLTFQGSFWFMTRDWWDKCDFMNDEGYNELHAQEAAYLGNTTWLKGGRVVTNKNTWYAHWHKKRQDGRGYHINERLRRKCYQYSYNHWVHENKDFFVNLIEKFWPLPNWPENWKEKLYGEEVS